MYTNIQTDRNTIHWGRVSGATSLHVDKHTYRQKHNPWGKVSDQTCRKRTVKHIQKYIGEKVRPEECYMLTNRQTDKQLCKQKNWQANFHTDKLTGSQEDRHTDTQTYIKTYRHTESVLQTDIQTYRHIYTQTHTHIQTHSTCSLFSFKLYLQNTLVLSVCVQYLECPVQEVFSSGNSTPGMKGGIVTPVTVILLYYNEIKLNEFELTH